MNKYELFKDSKKKWRFRIKSANNKIIAQSEAYNSKQAAEKTAKSLVDRCWFCRWFK